eukprot:6254219-Amphidinium_carterae.1
MQASIAEMPLDIGSKSLEASWMPLGWQTLPRLKNNAWKSSPAQKRIPRTEVDDFFQCSYDHYDGKRLLGKASWATFLWFVHQMFCNSPDITNRWDEVWIPRLRYQPGQQFKVHHDGTFRQKTLFVYLNDLPED